MNVLVTGGSGFLGAAVLPYLVRDRRIETVYLLLRKTAKMTAEERLDDLARRVFPPSETEAAMAKLRAVSGDLELPHLGLSDSSRDYLTKSCTNILHVGASTDFGAPLAESRRINVDGTRTLLDFALECRQIGHLKKFDYVSTAFVAGTKRGEVREADLARNQDFANNYERSKFEAELLVRSYQDQMPITITRPSIIVGDSRTGFTPHFKVLYWPLLLLSKNLIPFIPASRWAKLDIVPVDYVAQATHALLMADDAVGQTFHLTAGRGQELSIGGFLRDAFRFTTIRRRPVITFWTFDLIRATFLRRFLSDEFWQTAELAAVYNDYLRGTKVLFNADKTRDVLARHGVMPPPSWNDYRKSILSYCMETRWGKRLKFPEYLYRNPHLKAAEGGA